MSDNPRHLDLPAIALWRGMGRMRKKNKNNQTADVAYLYTIGLFNIAMENHHF